MALALVGAAAIGAPFGALYDAVKESMGRTVLQYKPLLGDLKFTLESLRPRIVQHIGDHNVELGLPNDDIESLQRQMEEGIVLVRKLSNIGMWNCYAWGSCSNCTTPSYSDQLVELDRSLRILLEILKLQEARDVKEVLLLARKIHDKQDELERRMSDLLKVQQEAGDVGGSSGSNTGTMIQQGNEGNGGHQVVPLGGVGGSGIPLKRLKLQQKEDVKAILLLNKEIRDTQVELDRKMSDILKLQQEPKANSCRTVGSSANSD
ncbi:unnamed protein product [Prunus armeniaca]|uniref:RPW8 domain-containing protein n=1 Tax=Prunus armeniaca TaxID=36596 RepID=A0A6J5XF37_PRUAR|nr:unnamed protein product [Prunus armeniaca]